jgi:hypothetical protein
MDPTHLDSDLNAKTNDSSANLVDAANENGNNSRQGGLMARMRNLSLKTDKSKLNLNTASQNRSQLY